MLIAIPSRGRAGRVDTLDANEWPYGATCHFELWVPASEKEEYEAAYAHRAAIHTVPDDYRIGDKRQAIVDRRQRIIMLDDDLRFYARRKDDPTKFCPPTPNGLKDMLRTVWEALHYIPMVAIAPREGGNRNTEPFMVDTRVLRAYALDCDWLRAHSVSFNRLPLMEDFDVTLQVLRAGGHNAVLNRYVHNQAGSNAAGGCSTYRTPERQAAAANGLALLHPGLVQVVQRTAKTGLGTRVDARMKWKQAYASGTGSGKAGVLDNRALEDLLAQGAR